MVPCWHHDKATLTNIAFTPTYIIRDLDGEATLGDRSERAVGYAKRVIHWPHSQAALFEFWSSNSEESAMRTHHRRGRELERPLGGGANVRRTKPPDGSITSIMKVNWHSADCLIIPRDREQKVTRSDCVWVNQKGSKRSALSMVHSSVLALVLGLGHYHHQKPIVGSWFKSQRTLYKLIHLADPNRDAIACEK